MVFSNVSEEAQDGVELCCRHCDFRVRSYVSLRWIFGSWFGRALDCEFGHLSLGGIFHVTRAGQAAAAVSVCM